MVIHLQCGLFDLLLVNMSIMISVLCTILGLPLNVFREDVRRKCMNLGGVLWASRSQVHQLLSRMKVSTP
jgi:hypothetical protein